MRIRIRIRIDVDDGIYPSSGPEPESIRDTFKIQFISPMRCGFHLRRTLLSIPYFYSLHLHYTPLQHPSFNPPLPHYHIINFHSSIISYLSTEVSTIQFTYLNCSQAFVPSPFIRRVGV